MKYYHDNNSIRQIKSFTGQQINVSYTSCLTIIELISGITSEDQFFRRKAILKAIHDSGIEVVWKTVASVLGESVGIRCETCDSDATKLMMEAILECDTYRKFLEINVNVCGKDYDINLFANYDRSFNGGLVNETASQSNIVSSSDRKSISHAVSGEYSRSYLQLIHEMRISQMVENLLPAGSGRGSDEYIKCIEYYCRNPRLRDYFICVEYIIHNALAGGGVIGRNDAFDYVHIIYTCFGGHLVSDDNFFRRIPKNLCTIRFLSVNEFREETAML